MFASVCLILLQKADYGDEKWLGIGWLGAQRQDNGTKVGVWAWASGTPWNDKATDWKFGRPLAMTPNPVYIRVSI